MCLCKADPDRKLRCDDRKSRCDRFRSDQSTGFSEFQSISTQFLTSYGWATLLANLADSLIVDSVGTQRFLFVKDNMKISSVSIREHRLNVWTVKLLLGHWHLYFTGARFLWIMNFLFPPSHISESAIFSKINICNCINVFFLSWAFFASNSKWIFSQGSLI